MSPGDIAYLESALASFILASINRVSDSGSMTYTYRISANDLKDATDRQRLHDSVISDCLAFLASYHVTANYNAQFAYFDLVLDLTHCVLNPQQARDLSIAMAHYREENT